MVVRPVGEAVTFEKAAVPAAVWRELMRAAQHGGYTGQDDGYALSTPAECRKFLAGLRKGLAGPPSEVLPHARVAGRSVGVYRTHPHLVLDGKLAGSDRAVGALVAVVELGAAGKGCTVAREDIPADDGPKGCFA